MNDYLDHVRSLEELHGLIERDLTSGTAEATKMLVDDIKAVADKILENAEKVVNRVYAESEAAVVRLTTEAKRGVEGIRKDAARAAADLVREGKTGDGSKRDALAAEKIIKEAGKAIEELNQKTAKALKALSEEAEAIAFKFKRRKGHHKTKGYRRALTKVEITGIAG